MWELELAGASSSAYVRGSTRRQQGDDAVTQARYEPQGGAPVAAPCRKWTAKAKLVHENRVQPGVAFTPQELMDRNGGRLPSRAELLHLTTQARRQIDARKARDENARRQKAPRADWVVPTLFGAGVAMVAAGVVLRWRKR